MNIDDFWHKASWLQKQWVLVRPYCRSDAEAARIVRVAPNTVCTWKHDIDLDSIVDSLLRDPRQAAIEAIQAALAKAVKIKIDALDSRKETVRQPAATEILDRAIGKPTQTQKLEGSVGIRLDTLFASLPPEVCTELRRFLAGAIAKGDDS